MTERAMEQAPVSGGQLLSNLLLFGRLLHGLGFDVSPGHMVELVQALQHVDLDQEQDFYYALRSILVQQREQLPLFDEAFQRFWWQQDTRPLLAGRSKEQASGDSEGGEEGDPAGERHVGLAPAVGAAHDAEGEQAGPAVQTFSRVEVLRRTDFLALTPDELREIRRMMARFRWQLGERRTRRTRPGSGSRPDMRRTLRQSVPHGGEIAQFYYRERKLKPRPLVILADVSGSMEQYTRILLHFIYSLVMSLGQPVEVFVFGTRLTRITRELRRRDVDEALEGVAEAVPDWAGGTRIGEALKRFNYEWGRRVLGRGAVVLIVSDGWDRGEPELLAREMGRLQRTCRRVIWLNPLIGMEGYEPLTRGLVAALPFVDDFLPAHNLQSLEALGEHLMSLRERTGR